MKSLPSLWMSLMYGLFTCVWTHSALNWKYSLIRRVCNLVVTVPGISEWAKLSWGIPWTISWTILTFRSSALADWIPHEETPKKKETRNWKLVFNNQLWAFNGDNSNAFSQNEYQNELNVQRGKREPKQTEIKIGKLWNAAKDCQFVSDNLPSILRIGQTG